MNHEVTGIQLRGLIQGGKPTNFNGQRTAIVKFL